VGTIRHFWREHYDFSFRRGKALYSRRQAREVSHTEACYAPGSDLVEMLLEATDPPEDVRDGIPRHFREWAKTAWVDEWNAHPDEATGGEIVEPAREEFRALVRAGLLTMHTLSVGKLRSGDETNVQRKPLLHYARSFGTKVRWGDVRGLSIWAKRGPHSPDVPRVAVRVEVFGQVGYHKFAGLSYTKFRDLCELYDVGIRCKVSGGDERAVELYPGFVADALAVPLDDQADGPGDGQPSPPPGGPAAPPVEVTEAVGPCAEGERPSPQAEAAVAGLVATLSGGAAGHPDGQEGNAGARAREGASCCPAEEVSP
jgi:hypothetical protein